MRLAAAGLFCLTAAALLIPTASAGAAVEFGDRCSGNEFAPGDYTITTLTAPGGALPLTAPINGVITQLRVRADASLEGPVPTMVKLLRSAGTNSFTVVDEALAYATPAAPPASVRIPVQAGDRLGLHGGTFVIEGSTLPSASIYCEGLPDGGELGAADGDVSVGSSAEFGGVPQARTPVSAQIEPDADNDGYGDETQDQCPQMAAVHTGCPPPAADAPAVALDTVAIAKRGSAEVLVTASANVSVTVSGSVSLGKKRMALLSAAAAPVALGQLVPFTLEFPGALKKALKALPPKRQLTLRINASAANAAGQPSTDNATVNLKGQRKRPARPHRKGGLK